MSRKTRKLPEEISRPLRPFARRVHRRHWLRRACLCLCAGIGAGIALLAVSFFVPIPHAMALAAGLAGLVALVSALAAFFVRRPPAVLAAEIDGCGFQERVQTMLALQDEDSPFATLQRADTLRALSAADPKACVPVRLPRRLLALAAAGLAAFCLLGFVPNPQDAVVQRQAERREELKQQAERVEAAIETLEKSTLDEARKAELNKQLSELARELRDGQDYKEGIRQASAIQQALGEAKQELFQKELEAVREAFEKQPATQPLANALQQAANAAEAARAVEQAVLEAIESGAPETVEELAQALREAAAQAGGALGEALEKLADALESGDPQAVAEAMQALNEALQSAEAASGEATENLSEQLHYVKSRLSQMASGNSGNSGGSGNSGSSSGAGGDNSGGGDGQGGGNSGSGQQGGGSGSGQGSAQGQGSGGQGQGGGTGTGELVEGEKIYDSSRLAGGGQQAGLSGDKQEGGPGQQAEVDTGTGTLDGYIPYQQVVGEYASDAIRAAERAQLPPAVQDWIRAYFEALQQS